jgi:hypothetical protein
MMVIDSVQGPSHLRAIAVMACANNVDTVYNDAAAATSRNGLHNASSTGSLSKATMDTLSFGICSDVDRPQQYLEFWRGLHELLGEQVAVIGQAKIVELTEELCLQHAILQVGSGGASFYSVVRVCVVKYHRLWCISVDRTRTER